MTEIADFYNPTKVHRQPPLSWYFDPKILEIEQRVLFDSGPGYVGHELLVPNVGDYHVLSWMDNAKVLVRNESGVQLLSNICRHRQATMLEGRGSAKHIVCPLHRWTYQMNGQLLGAPRFPQNPCLHLKQTSLQHWNGLQFAGKRDVAKDLMNIPIFKEFDFSNHQLDRVEIDEYAFNWKTFIEVYQEDYHVAPFHPGLGKFVNCDDLRWEFGDWYSIQAVGIDQSLRKAGSSVYGKWQEQVLRYNNGVLPKYGAIWLTYYPNVMVEWYPNTLIVSTVIPRGANSCTNIVEFYYPEDIVLFERDFVEAEKAAYRETALEDDKICLKMHQGRKWLHENGIEEFGPYQSPTEDGLLHFHKFIRRQLDSYLGGGV